MKNLRETQKNEAIRRMKMLGIFPETIRQFKEDDTVMCSESPFGAFYDLSEDQKKRIKEFETERNTLVYMVVRAKDKNIGLMDSLIYVSSSMDEWEMDIEDIDSNILLSYTINYDDEWCSEIGSIGIRKRGGGLIRVA